MRDPTNLHSTFTRVDTMVICSIGGEAAKRPAVSANVSFADLPMSAPLVVHLYPAFRSTRPMGVFFFVL